MVPFTWDSFPRNMYHGRHTLALGTHGWCWQLGPRRSHPQSQTMSQEVVFDEIPSDEAVVS